MGHGTRATAVALALILAALLTGGAQRGLFETSEGRYGSIAAEMSRSGDFLIPRLNGVEHFEKPPLAVWAMALSLRAFGETEAALRVPGALAAIAAVSAAFLLGGGRRSARGIWAAVLTLASPLFFALAQYATTDIYLAACSAATLLCAARSLDAELAPEVRARSLTLSAVFAALGFLVKGPVILVLGLGPIVLEASWSRDFASLRRIVSPLRVALFAAIAGSWFVAVVWRTPGLLGWFLHERAVGALASSEGFHSGPLLYYVPIVLLGLLPGSWILGSLGRSGWSELLAERRLRLMLCATLFPLVVFSLSASKLPTYALPLAVPTAVLASAALERGLGRVGVLGSAIALGALVAGGVVVGIARGWHTRVPPEAARLFAAAGAVILLGSTVATTLALRRRTRQSCAVLLGCELGALLLCVPAIGRAENQIVRSGSGREIARTLARLADDGRPILGYRCFVRSLPFYTRRRILLADFYEPDVTYARALEDVDVHGPEELRRIVESGPVAILCRTKQEADLEREVGPLIQVAVIGRYTILTNP